MGRFALFILVKRTADSEYKTLWSHNISRDKAIKLVNKYRKKAFDQGMYVFSYTLYGKGRDGNTKQFVDYMCFPSNVSL